MFFSIQNYHRLKEESERKKSEEQKLEKLRKEREKARIMAQTMQAHKLQVLNTNLSSPQYTLEYSDIFNSTYYT